MDFETDTATSHIDLLGKIETFALANGWTVHDKYDANGDSIESYSTSNPAGELSNNLILHSTGTSTEEDIYLKLQSQENAVAGYYNIRVQVGSEVLNDDSRDFLYKTRTGNVATFINSDMVYWLFGDANHIVCVARITTSYLGFYAGRFDAYGLPDAYPKPYCVCTNHNTSTTAYNGGAVGIMDTSSGISMIRQDSSVLNYTKTSGIGIYPLNGFNTTNSIHYLNVADDITNDVLERLEFFDDNIIYGALDGCMYVSAVNNAPENIKTVDNGSDTDNYIVFGNLTLTTEGNLWAIYKDTTEEE